MLLASGRKGARRDPLRAAVLFQRAAELGSTSACFHLACCYRRGEGVERSAKLAARWAFRATMCPRSALGAALTEEEEERRLLDLGDTAVRDRRERRELDERRRRMAEAAAGGGGASVGKHAQLKAAETAPRRRGTGGGCSRCGGKSPWACWRLQGAKAAHMLGVSPPAARSPPALALSLFLLFSTVCGPGRLQGALTTSLRITRASPPHFLGLRCSTPRAKG